MTWIAASKRPLWTLFILGTVWSNTASLKGWSSEDANLFFVSIVSQQQINGKTPVLLRWYSTQGNIPYTQFSVYRKEGNAASASPLQLLAVTTKLRNEPLIQGILEQPENQRAYQDLLDLLGHIVEEPITPANYVTQLINILEEKDGCNNCKLRRNMLVQVNYGAALVEGLAYVDVTDPKMYTYELRTSSGNGTDDLVLGRLTLDSTIPTKLSPPQKPVEVYVPGERGHLKNFLRWDNTALLNTQKNAMFGYNVYRATGDLSLETYDALLSQGKLQKINRLPILPPAADAVSSPTQAYMFVDDNQSLSKTGVEGKPFNPSEQYTYWVAARDLFGQNGEPSVPTVVEVKDQHAPLVPSDLATKVVEMSGEKRIALTWKRNPDDTVSYNIYRYQEYDHAGKTGPFISNSGLTEGYAANQPQSDADPQFYIDTAVGLPQQENRVFWYCVAAVDAAGNVSGLSAPIRGVLFDTTPPPPPDQYMMCYYQKYCKVPEFKLLDMQNSPIHDFNQLEFQIIRGSPEIVSVLVKRISTPLATTGFKTELILFSGEFSSDSDQLIAEDPAYVRGSDYVFSFTTADGNQCGPYPIPDEYMRQVYQYTGQKFIFSVHLTLDFYRNCLDIVNSGPVEHDPINNNGGLNPVEFQFPKVGDSIGILVYRSTDCEHYTAVGEVRFPPGQNYVNYQDFIRPEQGGRICYGIRNFDENHNLSPLVYIQTQIWIKAKPTGAVIPSVQKAESTGDATQPGILLTWFGSATGVAAYRIHFGTSELLQGNEKKIVLSGNQYVFDSKNNLYTAAIFAIDDITGEKVAINKSYVIHVESVLQNGEFRLSNNSVTFTWSSTPKPVEHPAWPIRPLPPTDAKLTAEWLPPTPGAQVTPFSYGTALTLALLPRDIQSVKDAIDKLDIKLPIIVYRRRVDIPNQTFIQVSPLLTSINLDNEGQIKDPFFKIRALYRFSNGSAGAASVAPAAVAPYVYTIIYLDTVNLIEGGKYEYKIVQLNPITGEIQKQYGPSNPVEVTVP